MWDIKSVVFSGHKTRGHGVVSDLEDVLVNVGGVVSHVYVLLRVEIGSVDAERLRKNTWRESFEGTKRSENFQHFL